MMEDPGPSTGSQSDAEHRRDVLLGSSLCIADTKSFYRIVYHVRSRRYLQYIPTLAEIKAFDLEEMLNT